MDSTKTRGFIAVPCLLRVPTCRCRQVGGEWRSGPPLPSCVIPVSRSEDRDPTVGLRLGGRLADIDAPEGWVPVFGCAKTGMTLRGYEKSRNASQTRAAKVG